MNTIGRFFGINAAQPAVVSGVAGSYTFTAPQALGVKPPIARNSYGDTAMYGQLLNLPGSGRLNGQLFRIVAAGSVIVPAGTTSPTFNIALNQNTFSFTQARLPVFADHSPGLPSRGAPFYTDDYGLASTVTTTSTTIATLASAQSLSAGTKVPFSLVVDLSGDGFAETIGVSFRQTVPPIPAGTQSVATGSGLLSGVFAISVNGISSGLLATTPLSNFNAFAENLPPAQLSVVATFGGSLSGSNVFTANLEQFQLEA